MSQRGKAINYTIHNRMEAGSDAKKRVAQIALPKETKGRPKIRLRKPPKGVSDWGVGRRAMANTLSPKDPTGTPMYDLGFHKKVSMGIP